MELCTALEKNRTSSRQSPSTRPAFLAAPHPDRNSTMATETTKTEVGSYFISNYPPFSQWTPEGLTAAREVFDSPPAEVPLGLYLHIPFCRKRCKFCYFRVYTDKNASEIEVYLDALANEIALYSKRGGFGGRQFEFVYFGGGTPSYLSNAQLERMVERINEHLTWSAP